MPNWDDVYAEKTIEHATPAYVLTNNESLLQGKGEALDFASGLAGNGIYLAEKGYTVTAWDLSQVAVKKINDFAKQKNLTLHAEMHDLEINLPRIESQFDLIVVSYFLHRESLTYLTKILKKDGLLFYQTFSGEQYNNEGPSRAAFRLNKNELLSVFSEMQLLVYREDDESAFGENSKPGQVFFVAKK